MIAATARLVARLALLLPIALLAACALSPAPVDHYFRLSAASLDQSFEVPRLRGALRVKRPSADALTDGSHLLYRRASNPTEVFREPYQLWTDAPSLMLREIFVEALREAGLAERVLPSGLHTPADYALASRVQRFERLIESAGERVTVEIEFSLVRQRDRSLLFQRSYSEATALEGSGAASSVEAYDRALTRILQRLIEDLGRELPSEVAGSATWPH